MGLLITVLVVLVAVLVLAYLVVLLVWLLVRHRLLAYLRRPRPPRPSRFAAPTQPRCANIPAHIYSRADPLIYDQWYLMSQGIAVTWDNPDVTIELGGVPVDQHDLAPATTYDVIARVWNGSVDAPAINLPVQFSYLSFGIGTQKHPIGMTRVDLGAKGAPGCPALAHHAWTTPATPGHYCLLVELVWKDDANPNNNSGQSNTDVKLLNSPHAAFDFVLANNTDVRHVYRFAVDAYALPVRPSCEGQPPAQFPVPTADELRARAAAVRVEHNRADFPVPAGWQVVVDPPDAALAPGESRVVTLDLTAPDGFSGREPFNVHAFDETGALAGGVTLTVRSGP